MSGYSEETGNAPAEDPGLLKTIGGYIAKPFVALNDFMRESREDQEARQEKSDLQTYEWAQSLAKKNLSGQESDPNYSQKLQNETNRIFNTEKLLEGGIEVGIYIGAGGVKSNAEGTTNTAIDISKLNSKPLYRVMTESELKAVQETGYLRGGREGPTYFTDSYYKNASNAQNRLSLPNEPEYIVEFKISNNPNTTGGNTVKPAYGGSGGGREYFSNDPVQVNIVNYQKMK
ncbi:hypothetical protein DCMF_11315 [Candidatus Formimonas warabiya]|uniref:Uncharacterized protein n=2 Tax=Formimonas warabiya TaxID=1761012 RepID=A0A3G1KS95_FORW1|nr:hypothetical protein DCMF_11315 [Candidatus Formimonas warabiya]